MAEEAREQWGTRSGFILAAVGSAVGLGNIWRFPYVAYENGGGAFIVPYLVALLTAGIPVLVLEYAIGHRFFGSAPLSYRRLSRKGEWIGWWQTGVGFLISTYYAVVIAWAAAYTWFAVGQRWGDDPETFFFESYLGVVDAGSFGSFRPLVLLPLLLVWLVTIAVGLKGVQKGIEKVNKIFIPLLVTMFLLLVVRSLTLPGATVGLETLFTPDWSRIADGGVWVAAYGQIFFSLSIAFAIMITYASYLPRRSDLTNNAFIAGFANSSFELLAGIGVFAAVGFLATSQGVAVEDVARDGIGLAFIVFPQIISELPTMNSLFGVLFFGSLVIAGLSSLISITQVYVAAAQEKLGWSRTQAVLVSCSASIAVSLVYATQGGINVLDTVDHFINNFGIALIGLVEVVFVAWVIKEVERLRGYANDLSDIHLGPWWRLTLKTVTPLLLGWMLVDNLMLELSESYNGYPLWFNLLFGVGSAALVLVASLLASRGGWAAPDEVTPTPSDDHDPDLVFQDA